MPQIWIFYVSETEKVYKFETEEEALSFVATFITGKREGETINCIHRVEVPGGTIEELEVVLDGFTLKFRPKE